MAGNKGYSFFSEKAFNDLKKAIDIMTKLENISKSERLNAEKQVELITRYKSQLEDLGIKKSDTLKSLQREYAIEKDIYEQKLLQAKINEKAYQDKVKSNKEKENELKRNKLAMQWEKDFAEETSDKSKEEIENQKKLNKIKEEGLKKAQDLRLSEKKRNELLDEYSKKYKAEVDRQNALNKQKEKQQNRINNLGTAFGISSSDIQNVKDGSYLGKKAAEIFSKAVNIFAQAVKAGINQNYNTAEETLNRITASNQMSWSSGSFSFGGKSYNGYKQINNAVNDQLLSEGLFNNIDNTEVLKATAQLTSSGGFSLEEAIAKGYQDTVIKYIVPYLDTSSEAYESLEMLMPRYF